MGNIDINLSSRSYSENAFINNEECNFNSKSDELVEAITQSYASATGPAEIHLLLNIHAI